VKTFRQAKAIVIDYGRKEGEGNDSTLMEEMGMGLRGGCSDNEVGNVGL
jgi:hypothetical protein